ncbi:MAG: GNAT family N-acetyltransferase [Pseudolabrys sp.]
MSFNYMLYREFSRTAQFLEAVRTHADNEREALGFLPGPAYAEAAQQGKLIVLAVEDDGAVSYAGHLLFGGIFPHLRVRQICVSPKWRGHGFATKLLRALKSQAEADGYLSIVANVATDLGSANSFYEKNGFATRRMKSGGTSRNRTINVKTLQLDSPSLLSLMSGATVETAKALEAKRRGVDVPLYAIDLNVFFDVVKPQRPRSSDAGALFKAALDHQIRLAASVELIRELERTSRDRNLDPILALARQIPVLPAQRIEALEALSPDVSRCIFPDNSNPLTANDLSDIRHVCHAIAAKAAGYVTSDAKVLMARDALMSQFGLDIIALSELAEMIDLPLESRATSIKATHNFYISSSNNEELKEFFEIERVAPSDYLGAPISKCQRLCISDAGGLIGVALLRAVSQLEGPSRSAVCVRQAHPYSSTIADFLIAEQVRICAAASKCVIELLDVPHHPITRRIALNHGFRQRRTGLATLSKVAVGEPITKDSWESARLAIERLTGIKLQAAPPSFDAPGVRLIGPDASESTLSLLELESLLSPTILALPKRKATIIPITKEFANALLETQEQLSMLDVPEAQFLSRRSYFNTINAAKVMAPGTVLAFYESVRSGGRGAVVALARAVDAITIPKRDVPEIIERGGVVSDLSVISKADRVLVTTFDNLLPLPKPVGVRDLKAMGCDSGTNFITATSITLKNLEQIIASGFPR